MKRLVLSILFLTISSLHLFALSYNSGFAADTIITTNENSNIPISQVTSDTSLQCLDNNLNQQESIKCNTNCSNHKATHYYKIVVENESFICGDDQELYDYYMDKYFSAREMHASIKQGRKFLLSSYPKRSSQEFQAQSLLYQQPILDIQEINLPTKSIILYDLNIEQCHNFKIGKGQFIAHSSELLSRYHIDLLNINSGLLSGSLQSLPVNMDVLALMGSLARLIVA